MKLVTALSLILSSLSIISAISHVLTATVSSSGMKNDDVKPETLCFPMYNILKGSSDMRCVVPVDGF